jgi:hypothetical protein
MSAPSAYVHRLVGVYDADGTVRGELAYWFGARFGRAHCSLCDITHGRVRATGAWRDYRASLPVPFDTFHRDDQPHAVRAAAGGTAPVVVAEIDTGLVLLLDTVTLDACVGSVDQLAQAIDRAMTSAGMAFGPYAEGMGDSAQRRGSTP